MSVNFCQHVKVDGTLCQVPPLDGRQFCHFHLEIHGQRARMARARARREPYHLVLPIVEDLNSVLVARQQVMDALNAGLIERKHAGVLLFSLQGIAGDLRSAKAPRLGVYDPKVDTAPRATAYPDFEEKYDLRPDLDLTRPPDGLFAAEAAAAEAAAQARDQAARSARRGPRREVTREDIELEEILITHGQEAHDKRAQEMENREYKRLQQERRKLAEVRQMAEAARRNHPEELHPKLQAHYDKLRAEEAAKEKAGQEEMAALRAAAQVQAEAARKSPESASAAEAKGASERTGS